MKRRQGSYGITAHRPKSTRAFLLGREQFERISAVEGIRLTSEARSMLDEFDRAGMSPAERRQAIIKRYAPKR